MSIKKSILAFLLVSAITSAAVVLPLQAQALEVGELAEAEFDEDLESDTELDSDISFTDLIVPEYVSDGDISDGAVSESDHISNYPLKELKVDYFRLKMLVPDLKTSFSAADTNQEIHDKLFDTYGIGSVREVLNYSDYYGSNTCYIYNGSSESSDITMLVMYDENNYTRYIGDYSRLSEEEIKDLCGASDFLSTNDPVFVRSVHGRTFVCQMSEDAESGAVTYYLDTITGGGVYTIYIDLADSSKLDESTIEHIIDSVRIKGTVKERYGAASKTYATILSVICGLLLLATALLCFFLYRFNAFAKAAGSSFSVIGFNMPPKELPQPSAARVSQNKNRHHDSHR